MALIKTPKEIEALKRGGILLSQITRELRSACVPGVTTEELDALARRRMKEYGGTPSFLGYRMDNRTIPFPGALCTSINDEVVHGLPIPAREIYDGDVVSLDIGMWYEKLATDMATTVIAGTPKDGATVRLLRDTREALVRGITVVKEGAFVHDIGRAIETFLAPKKYGIVRDLVGHGVGHEIHEEPMIPNVEDHSYPPVPLKEGMVLAIEPMITLGSWCVKQKRDGWTVVSADGSMVAHFELTIVVTKKGYELITPWPDA